MHNAVEAIVWSGDHLRLLDQRRLPAAEVWLECRSSAQVADAIGNMAVRGAPAIGIAAAYGMAMASQSGENLRRAEAALAASRPTAVNLTWALRRMHVLIAQGGGSQALIAEAQAIHVEDRQQNQTMGRIGADLLPDQAVVITHCNTGALATGGHGTALGVIRSAWQQKKIKRVYNTETRPWLQGARLTSWELQREGIESRLMADGAAAHLMATGVVDWVIVGADRIAANGDTANKIGTYSLAVSAWRHGVKFMVVAPGSSFDLDCKDGTWIPIEERGPGELVQIQSRPIAPAGTQTWNPVFDVTPAELIDAIVCEHGVIQRPESGRIARFFESPNLPEV